MAGPKRVVARKRMARAKPAVRAKGGGPRGASSSGQQATMQKLLLQINARCGSLEGRLDELVATLKEAQSARLEAAK